MKKYSRNAASQPTGEVGEGVGVVYVESGISTAARRGLERLGHRVKVGEGGFGGYQAIQWDRTRGVYIGASEMRKDGAAIGY